MEEKGGRLWFLYLSTSDGKMDDTVPTSHEHIGGLMHWMRACSIPRITYTSYISQTHHNYHRTDLIY
jgi:hypothetical protein